MPDLLQRAQGALWRLFLMLAMFGGVGYIVWDAQVDLFPSLLVPSTWFLYSYMLFFPTSRVAVGAYSYFDDLDTSDITMLRLIFVAFFIFQAVYQRSPVGIIYPVFLGIVNCCVIQCGERRALAEVAAAYCAAYRAAKIAATRGLTAAPKPDAAAAEPDREDDSDNPRALVAFVDRPAVEEIVEPTPRARGWMKKLWSTLLKIGFLTLVTHALIDALHKNWALTQASVVSAPLFEAELVVQANKTELPIRVPIADFIPTGTLGSPCQAAPTPTPVAKSIATVMSTPMPTPMPAPTPSAVPEPEPKPAPVVIHDEPLKLLHSLFDFDIPDPKPLLAWYFDLPPASQYTVIVISLLLIWVLSKPLITLAAYLVTFAFAYFTTAAVLPLLSIYGFTPVQSVIIGLPAAFILIAIILQTRLWLKKLASMSWNNAAGLTKLESGINDLRAQSEHRLVDIRRFMTAVHTILSDLLSSVDRFKAIASGQGRAIKKLNSQIKSLVMDKANNVDLEQIMTVINEISGDMDDLKDSKADAPLLLAVQKKLDTLFPLVDSLRSEKADASDLEKLQRKLDDLTDRFDNLQNANANATEIESINAQMKRLKASLDNIRSTQQKLITRVDTLQAEMNDAQTEIDYLHAESTEHGSSTSRLEGESKASRKAIEDLEDQVANNKKDADDKISKLERENAELRKDSANVREENTGLKRDISDFRDDMKAMRTRVDAMETKQITDKNLKELQDNITSDVDVKVSQLRTETGHKHEQAVQDHKALRARFDTSFADSTQAVNDLREEVMSKQQDRRKDQVERSENCEKRLTDLIDGVEESLKDQWDEACIRFTGISERIDAVNESALDVLQRVEAVESQEHVSFANLEADDDIRRRVYEYMDDFLVSNKFRAPINDTQLTLKKKSKLDQVRSEVRAYAEKTLESKEFQDQVYAKFKERQAINNNIPGDPPGVISGDRASSPGIDPSDPDAAPPKMSGNDDLPGDPAEVVPGGRATLPGSMSSDNTTTPTIPEESTIPDDVDDHHGTLGVLSDDPPEVLLGRRSMSLGGLTSDGPSGDDGSAPRPSGGDNDDTVQPKEREGEASRQHDGSTGEQLPGPANRDQPGGEQDEGTDEEDTDDENDEGHEGRDGDDSDGDDSPSPPPGDGGGSHGHNGTGRKDDDDRGGSNGGASHQAPAPRPAPGLSGSMFAPGDFQSRPPAAGSAHQNNGAGGNDYNHQGGDNRGAPSPSPASGVSHGRSRNGGVGGVAQDEDGDSAKGHRKKGKKSLNQTLREATGQAKRQHKFATIPIAKVEEEQRQREQGEPLPTKPTEAEKELDDSRDSLTRVLNALKDWLEQSEQAHKTAKEAGQQAEQALEQLEPAQNQQQQGKDRRPEAREWIEKGEDQLKKMEVLLQNYDANRERERKRKEAKQQEQGQNELGQDLQSQEWNKRRKRGRGKGRRDNQQGAEHGNQHGKQNSNGQAEPKDGGVSGGMGGGSSGTMCGGSAGGKSGGSGGRGLQNSQWALPRGN